MELDEGSAAGTRPVGGGLVQWVEASSPYTPEHRSGTNNPPTTQQHQNTNIRHINTPR